MIKSYRKYLLEGIKKHEETLATITDPIRYSRSLQALQESKKALKIKRKNVDNSVAHPSDGL